MTIEQLAVAITSTKQKIDMERSKLEILESELLQKVSSTFEADMAAKEKFHGSVTGEIDGVKMKFDVKQTVSWDQKSLRKLWEALPVEIGNKLIETKFFVKESVYNAQADPAIISALNEARTTKLSTPKIEICD